MRIAAFLSAASFAVFGASLTLPGTLLPLLVPQFDMSLVAAGSMLAFQPAAYLAVVLFAAPLVRRFGMRASLCASVLTFAAGIAGFGLMSSWAGGVAMLALSGLGFGLMEVAVNTLLIRVGGDRSTNLLNFTHLFFGVGSFVAPAVSAHAVAAGASWREPFWVAGAVTAAVAVGWGFLPDSSDGLPTAHEEPPRTLQVRRVVLLAVALGLYVGAEMGIGSWLTKFMVSVHAVDLSYAGNTLSLYWLSLAAGRFVLGFLSHRLPQERLLMWLSIVSLGGVAAAVAASSPLAAAVSFAVTGAGLSGIFPGVIALGGRSFPHDVARVMGYLVTGAGIGGIVLPWIMSAIADAGGLVAGMTFYAVVCAVMLLLTVLVVREPAH